MSADITGLQKQTANCHDPSLTLAVKKLPRISNRGHANQLLIETCVGGPSFPYERGEAQVVYLSPGPLFWRVTQLLGLC